MTDMLQKNKNVANENSQDLTEQMHKGELPYAEYYIKLAGGEYTNDVWDIGGWQSFNKKGDVVVEVLAPVPSYNEWEEKLRALDAAYETIKMEDETINRLVRSGKQCNYENAQLKELLKECQVLLKYLPIDDYDNKGLILDEKIDEALR